jgi:hypothetical protein
VVVVKIYPTLTLPLERGGNMIFRFPPLIRGGLRQYCSVKAKKQKYIGWVEARNPTFSMVC